MENDSGLSAGDSCPYCGRVLHNEHAILNCICCEKQGCSDCICAGACCIERDSEQAA